MTMGGLKKYMPITRSTFMICCLAIAGIFPFAGFFSKDEILGGASTRAGRRAPPASASSVVYGKVINLATGVRSADRRRSAPRSTCCACTSSCSGASIAAAPRRREHAHESPRRRWHGHDRGHALAHESPPAMTVVPVDPRRRRAASSASSASPTSSGRGHDLFGEWLVAGAAAAGARRAPRRVRRCSRCIALGVSLLGIGLAWLLYGDGVSPRVEAASSPAVPAALPGSSQQVLHRRGLRLPRRAPGALHARASCGRRSTPSSSILLLVNGVGFIVVGLRQVVEVSAERRSAALHRRRHRRRRGHRRRRARTTTCGPAPKFDAKVAGPRRAGHRARRRPDGQAPAVPRRLERRRQVLGARRCTPTFRHTLRRRAGSHKIAVEAIDPRWGTVSRESHTVKVQ